MWEYGGLLIDNRTVGCTQYIPQMYLLGEALFILFDDGICFLKV